MNRHATWLLVTLALQLVRGGGVARAVMDETTACLVGFLGAENGSTIERGATNGSCTFNLQVCANRAEGSCTGTTVKPVKVKVKGKCKGARDLRFAPSGDTPSCGSASAVTVKLKGHG